MLSLRARIRQLLQGTSIRWLLMSYHLVLLIVTLGALSFAIHYLLGRFLWQASAERLRVAVAAGWYAELDDDAPKRRVVGLAAPRTFPNALEDITRRSAGRELFVRALDLDGNVLAEAGRFRQPPPVDAEQLQLLKMDERHSVDYFYQGKREWQVVLLPITDRGAWVGTLQACGLYRPNRELLSALDGYLLSGGLAAGLLALLLTFGLTRLLFYPLRRLMAATRRVREGDLAARTGLTSGNNEIFAVAAAFDGMVNQLEETFEAQRRFVADASHELKTPLTAIGGMAEVLRVGADGGRPELALRTIEKEVDRMSALVADLLTLSAAEQVVARSVVDLGPVLKELTTEMGMLYPDRRFVFDGSGDLKVRGDVQRVFRNLVDNAQAYSSGDVVVKAQRIGDRVLVSVSDTGPGIAASDLPHIFDRFYRADASRARKTGGSGLGLAIVRALVEQHGGTVEARSTPGEGSVFTVNMPAV